MYSIPPTQINENLKCYKSLSQKAALLFVFSEDFYPVNNSNIIQVRYDSYICFFFTFPREHCGFVCDSYRALNQFAVVFGGCKLAEVTDSAGSRENTQGSGKDWCERCPKNCGRQRATARLLHGAT